MSLLRLPAAGAFVLAGWSGAALASEAGIAPADLQAGTAKVELIDSSRLGCGQGVVQWTVSSGGSQCAFDTATRGARVTALQELGSGSIEASATMARITTGPFTPDQLLISPESRSADATDLFVVGFKGSVLDNRLKLTAEFARSQRVVDALIEHNWALADWTSRDGTSALVRLEATLANRPGLKWSLTGEFRSVSDGYSVGFSPDLLRHFAMPGTRLALSSKARIGELALNARVDEARSPFGKSSSRKAGLDFQGISLTLRARESSAGPIEGSTLLGSSTRTTAAYLDLDSQTLAGWLLPSLDRLPMFVPASVSLSYQAGETETRYVESRNRYSRATFGLDAIWETPLGDTSLGYWRDDRLGITEGARSRSTETFQVDHSIRHGNWRFGLDASLSRTRGDGSSGYDDRSLSFGQSVAYSVPAGPEFRLQLGQDRGQFRMTDDSYVSSDRFSRVTASLDLSRYLQKRFERPDLRLTLDYRKMIDRSESEMNLYDELVERWTDGYRREGLLVSFGMKL